MKRKYSELEVYDFMKESLGIYFKDMVRELKSRGFFEAPASTKYHGNYEGGLADHSLEVALALEFLTERCKLTWQRKESPYIVGLNHDLCKCDKYELVDGKYGYKQKELLAGHGDKSAMVASTVLKLTEEEMLCIRYHMGAYETKDWDGYDLAIKKYPNVLFTHTADMMVSKIKRI